MALTNSWKCVNTLDIFAPRKKKYLRGNNIPFMNQNVVNAHRKQFWKTIKPLFQIG